MNVYAFVGNQAVKSVDSLGLLEVTSDLQRPRDVPVDWGTPAEENWLGQTSKDGTVDCTCRCPQEQKTKHLYWYAECTVTTRYSITLSLKHYESKTWEYWRGVYGHEMAHVASRNKLVQNRVIDDLMRQKDKFTDEDACLEAIGRPRARVDKKGKDITPKGNGYIQTYQRILNEQMKGGNHKGEDMANDLSPGKSELINRDVEPPRPPSAKPTLDNSHER